MGHLRASAAARRSPHFVRVLLAAWLIGSAGVAQATDDGESAAPESLKELSLEQLMDLEVTSATRHPEKLSGAATAIQVITADDIRRSGATSLPEALRLASNLDVAQKNAHDWAITARGFNTALANKLLVMIDGRTVYTPLFSGVFWDAQDVLLEDIDRIEVISGPGGTLWGANAVNGIINIVTRAAGDTQGLHVEAGGGSQPRDFGAVRYGAALAPDVAVRVYANAFNRSEEERVDASGANDAWRRSQAGFRLDAGVSPHDRFTLQGDAYDGDESMPAGGAAHTGGANLLGRWSHRVSDRRDWTLQAYFDRTRLDDPIPALVLNGIALAPAGVLTDALDTFDVDFQNRIEVGGRNEVTWGLGYRHTRDKVDNAPALAFLPPTLDQNLYSVFAQDELTLRKNLVLTLGTKLEHNDYTGLEAEPSIRLAWNFAEDQSLWAAVSRAVRTPSRVDRDESVPAPQYILIVLRGSADFTSESVVARELGYRAQFGPTFALSASAFDNDYYHLRSTGVDPATLLPFVFQNNLEGPTHGVELSADWRATDRWRLRAGYDLLEEHLRAKPGAVDINDAHNETADPKARWSLRSSLDIADGASLDVGLRGVGARRINAGAALAAIPGYTEMDIALAWRATDHIELSVAGQNLLHARHLEYGFPNGSQILIGRSVYGKIAWTY